ncbi:MAG: hypothetical protein HDS16_03900, partial [Bacteroides sp.]|nr:hypothetical protein [Bacteroides sp.]
ATSERYDNGLCTMCPQTWHATSLHSSVIIHCRNGSDVARHVPTKVR